VNEVRDLAFYLSRACTDASVHAIAAAFGLRSRSAVTEAIRRIEKPLDNNPKLLSKIKTMKKKLGTIQLKT